MKNRAARKLKQIPAGYLTIGIDPHKRKLVAVAITEDLMVRTRFKFDNSRDGFERALENARAEMAKAGSHGVIFAIETGGHYWRNFAYFLEERGIPFRLVSQITLKRMRDGRDVTMTCTMILIGLRTLSQIALTLSICFFKQHFHIGTVFSPTAMSAHTFGQSRCMGFQTPYGLSGGLDPCGLFNTVEFQHKLVRRSIQWN